MKVLYKDRIVETYQFPFTEALSFSILLWTVWGFLEAFYWHRLAPLLRLSSDRLDPLIYIISFLLYLTVALVVAGLVYSLVKWSLFTLEQRETSLFRGVTLSCILAVFFLMILAYLNQKRIVPSSLPLAGQYGILAITLSVVALITFVMYRRASNESFRIRGSGTTMFSVLVLSLLMSVVTFPIFASAPETSKAPAPEKRLDLKASMKKLMVYYYIQALTPGGEQPGQ
jgi:hypothetical protein